MPRLGPSTRVQSRLLRYGRRPSPSAGDRTANGSNCRYLCRYLSAPYRATALNCGR
jgi:hypothetical protein